MDPNEALRIIFDNEALLDEQAVALEGLYDWLMCGGFVPAEAITSDVMFKLIQAYYRQWAAENATALDYYNHSNR